MLSVNANQSTKRVPLAVSTCRATSVAHQEFNNSGTRPSLADPVVALIPTSTGMSTPERETDRTNPDASSRLIASDSPIGEVRRLDGDNIMDTQIDSNRDSN